MSKRSFKQRFRQWLLTDKRSAATEIMWNGGTFGISSSSAGEPVTSDTALGLATYFAGVRNISEDVAKLPIRMYRERKDGNAESERDHELLNVLRRPNPYMTGFNFWSTIMCHKIGFSGGFAEIVRDETGQPRQLWPIDPKTVTVLWDRIAEELAYEIRMTTGERIILRADQVFHVRGMGYDGFTQFALAKVGQEAIGRGLAAQKFSGAFFGNGATLKGVLEAPPTLQEKNLKLLQDTFTLRHAGAKEAYRTPILPDGVKYTTIESEPEKSQLIETQSFSGLDACRLLRIPPHKVQHLENATFSNIGDENRFYALDTLMPHTKNLCEEIALKLLSERERDRLKLFCKFDFAELLEADPETKTNILVKEFQTGQWTTNELLAMKGQAGIGPDGDQRFVMSGLQALDGFGEEPEPLPEPPAEDGSGTAPQMTGDMDQQEKSANGHQERAFEHLFSEQIGRLVRTHDDKCNRAAQKDPEKFAEWAENFYHGHRKSVLDNLDPCFAAAMSAVHGIESNGTAARFVDEYCDIVKNNRSIKTPLAQDEICKTLTRMAMTLVATAGETT